MNIRKFVVRAERLDDLVGLGTVTAHAAAFLDAAVQAGLNVLVSGGTQAGKTTLLNCLAAAIPAHQRVVTVEEVFELKDTSPELLVDGVRAVASGDALLAPSVTRRVIESYVSSRRPTPGRLMRSGR